MLFGKWKPLVVCGVVSIIIVSLIFALTEWSTLHRQTRRAQYYYPASVLASVVLNTHFPNPCSPNGTVVSKVLYFCYENNRTETVITFQKSQFRIGGYTADKWGGYDWYLDGAGYKQGHNWQHVFSTTARDWSNRSYGTSDVAQQWGKRVHFISATQHRGQQPLSLHPASST